MAEKEIQKFRSELDLKTVLAKNYIKQINNFFGDEKKALAFLSAVMATTQRIPQLIECTPVSVINSFMTMAQLGFMPSAVSGEAFVLPYKNKGVLEAQFQLGYQGIVTLLYRAGAQSIVSEIVRKNDSFRIVNGALVHEMDPFKTRAERGEPVGAYAIITLQQGGRVEKFMRMDEIQDHAKKFSKSFASEYSPWKTANDPEGWMPRKTVLKQAAKLAPKNETLNFAIGEDNKDSVIQDRMEAAVKESDSLKMGALLENKKEKDHDTNENKDGIDEPAKEDPEVIVA